MEWLRGVIKIVQTLILSYVFLVVLTGVGNAQESLEIKHDESGGTTTVTTKTQQLAGEPLNGVHLKLVGTYESEAPTKITRIGVLIFSVGDKAGFEKNAELILRVNRAELRLGQMRREFVEDDSIRYMEGLYIDVSLEKLRMLASSSRVEGTVGTKRFVLRPIHQKAIKSFVEYFESCAK